MPSATLSSEGATLNSVLGTGTSVHFSTSVHSRVDVPVPMIHEADFMESPQKVYLVCCLHPL